MPVQWHQAFSLMNIKMSRPKKVTAASVDISELAIVQGEQEVQAVKVVHPLTQEFGNGDLNILRDKINEIIRQ